jgi:hypothetical protein
VSPEGRALNRYCKWCLCEDPVSWPGAVCPRVGGSTSGLLSRQGRFESFRGCHDAGVDLSRFLSTAQLPFAVRTMAGVELYG